MIYQINDYFLPCIFNNDYTGELLTPEEIHLIKHFPIDLSTFSVFELENGEFLNDFGKCDICHELSNIVILYNELDDVETIKKKSICYADYN